MSHIKHPIIRIEASSFCQLRCPSCPTTTGEADHVGKGYLRFKNFRQLIDENPHVKEVELSNNGEIFLNPELTEILEYAHEKSVAITMQNGVNLNNVNEEQLEAVVKYGVKEMSCSIDGASQETYKRYRVRGNFDTVIANIELINHFKKTYESHYPFLAWQYVIFGHNEHELPVAREMAMRLSMEFRPKLTWDNKFSPIRNPDFVRKESGLPAVTREEFLEETGEKYLMGLCDQLWDRPQINWDGRILGCCRNYWGDFGGNAFSDGLVASLNSENINYAREMLQGKRPARESLPCIKCENYIHMQNTGTWLKRETTESFENKLVGHSMDSWYPTTLLVPPEGTPGTYNFMTNAFPSDAHIKYAEIGCYRANTAVQVAKRFPNAEIYLFDYEEMIEEAKSAMRPFGDRVKYFSSTQRYCDSYNWSLLRLIEQNPDPIFDYVFIDGAHTVAMDALAFFLADKLLKRGGYIDLDDFDWRLRDYSLSPEKVPLTKKLYSEEQIDSFQVQMIIDLLVKRDLRYRVRVNNKIFQKRHLADLLRKRISRSLGLS